MIILKKEMLSTMFLFMSRILNHKQVNRGHVLGTKPYCYSIGFSNNEIQLEDSE